ncbi:DUF6221 family protein [Streptomyces lunaelactis]|uniref:DUF6221 family protein n=1 Tax=Streptomyces lunaelactis TaxID=1535768 RepID=UPI001C2F8C8E|nr:DUF6221 family protein [Streptomyces lunaelactis]
MDVSGFHPAIAEHVALHDPARVLREVAAKRRVLARHVLSPASGDPELPWDNRDDCQYDGEDWPCPDLLDLALIYTDHPSFREQWVPHQMGTKLLRKRGSQTGPVRNRSCVCGSGLKFKRCCGQEGQ